MDQLSLLKEHFGHRNFRPGQEPLIDALLSGRDVLGVMPTGAGKSVCYQLPALLLPGITLVISPLISLMKDQVAALSQAGIPSAYINSSLTAAQCREAFRRAKMGAYKIIYVAPERLTTSDFLRFAEETQISLLAVDEAHCVSQWGQDFRPSYLKIAEFIAVLSQRPVVGAFTATATVEVKKDIEKLLLLQKPLQITTGFDRPNLYFEVVSPKRKESYLQAFLAGRPGQSGIVYCATRKAVESVCESLIENGIAATRYHAGLEDDERRKNQEDFAYDRARVMVATNAFGMGIDKSNVSFVVHYNMPKNIESYYQEAGRAGRDGEKAHCVLLFSAGDVQTARFLLSNSEENEVLSKEEQALVHCREMERLDKMVAYCKTTDCLRGNLLQYFGEEFLGTCGNCGNCTGEMVQQDITVEAQKILSAVARVGETFTTGLGVTLIVRMLHGSKEQRIKQLGLDKLSTYGTMYDTDRTQIRAYIDHLMSEGYLVLVGDEYPVLHMTERAREVLFQNKRVVYTCRKQTKEQKTTSLRKSTKDIPVQGEDDLFTALKILRNKLAQEENVPAYIIFSNASLADMAEKRPETMADFRQVSGVGEVKAARYGQVFLERIVNWVKEADKHEHE